MTLDAPLRPAVVGRPAPPTALILAACVLAAAASLTLRAALGFDPWAWLVWGREIAGLDLDTTGGPSWKPLPVVITTILSASGDAAPMLWVVLARTAALMLGVGAFRLASRFAGPAAGALAVALLVLIPDGEPRFLRTVLEAHGAPLTAALALWAIDRHLDGRRGTALALTTGLALMRPESWPFLVLYCLWLWRRQPSLRRMVLPALGIVPVLWFGGDLWGAGDPLHGADAAQVGSGDPVERATAALGTAVDIVVIPVWLAAAGAVATARRRGASELAWFAALTTAWCAVVVAMAVTLRYAAISRFFLPAAALASVLGAIGAVRLFHALRRTVAGAVAAAALLVVAVALTLPRLLGLSDVAEEISTRAALQGDLDAAIELAGGREAVLACGAVAVEGSTLLRPALAWKLQVPLGVARRTPHARPGVWFTVARGRTDRELSAAPTPDTELIGRSSEWALYRVGCPPGGA